MLSQLGRHLEAAAAPEAVLPTIVETIGRTLKLPFVAIAVTTFPVEAHPSIASGRDYGVIVARYGVSKPIALRLPLLYHGAMVGQLLLAARTPQERFTVGDRVLLDTIAAQTSVIVYATQLSVERQQSRERLRNALEEERRRLRRDLHDGLGPTLASQVYIVDTACKVLRHDPAMAENLLEDVKRQAQAASAEIRRLVYGLRPPALDELGLLGALREHLSVYQRGGFTVVLRTPIEMPVLSAAVEVAVYRIVMEAVTNVVHHAQAETCVVSITFGTMLQLTIEDNGCGVPAEHQSGVGLRSMRERASELGGQCTIEQPSKGGTRVVVTLPLQKEVV